MIACAAPYHLLDLLYVVGVLIGGGAVYFPGLIKQNMPKILKTLFILLCLLTTACSSAWKVAYVGGATTASFVTDTHREAWSLPLNHKAAECANALNPQTTTKKDFDRCMSPYTAENNKKVQEALVAYNAAAKVLSELLLATDPKNPDKKRLLSAWEDTLKAALHLVGLFPAAEKYTNQLQVLTNRL